MNIPRFLPVLLGALLAAPAGAQTAGKPLNLKLPPSDVPVASSTAAKPAAGTPGVYYGDTSGRMGNTEPVAAAPDCDDSTYNEPQVHGSVSTGVMTGNRGSGSWNAGEVSISKSFGDCAQPTGTVNFSVGTSRGEFHPRHGH